MEHIVGWEQLSPVIVYANRLNCEPGSSFGPRVIKEYQFIYVIYGQGNAFIGDRTYEAKAGDLFFYGPDLNHRFVSSADKPFSLYGLHFIPDGQIPAVGAIPLRPPTEVKPGYCTGSDTVELLIGDAADRLRIPEYTALSSGFAEVFFARAVETFQQPDARHHFDNRALLSQFLLELHRWLRQARTTRYSPEQTQLVESMKLLLQQHAKLPYQRRWLSEWSRYHENHASSLFVLHAGISPHDYFINCKLELAKKMLADGLSVLETANALHFNSIHHFSRLFKRRVGCPPSLYRQFQTFI